MIVYDSLDNKTYEHIYVYLFFIISCSIKYLWLFHILDTMSSAAIKKLFKYPYVFDRTSFECLLRGGILVSYCTQFSGY